MKLVPLFTLLFLPIISFGMFTTRIVPRQAMQMVSQKYYSENHTRDEHLLRCVQYDPSPFLLHEIVKEKKDELLVKSLNIIGLRRYINTPYEGNTALHCATQIAYLSGVKTLLNFGAHVNAPNESKRTALIQAVISLCDYCSPDQVQDLMKIVIVLKESGAKSNIIDDYRKTAHDYLREAVQDLDLMRSRTIKNENGHLLQFYDEIQKILYTEYKE